MESETGRSRSSAASVEPVDLSQPRRDPVPIRAVLVHHLPRFAQSTVDHPVVRQIGIASSARLTGTTPVWSIKPLFLPSWRQQNSRVLRLRQLIWSRRSNGQREWKYGDPLGADSPTNRRACDEAVCFGHTEHLDADIAHNRVGLEGAHNRPA